LSNYQLIIYPGTTLYEIVKKDPIHASRALEGYHTPYYYRKPELELWNYLSEKYLNQKEDLPGYVVFLLKKRQYAILKLILQPKLRNSYKIAINHYRKFGLIKTLKKGLRRILSKE
jgi:hypothetical protein